MSIAGIELITRNSLNSLRHASQGSNYLQDTLNNQPTDDRSWSWGYLRRQFRNKNLDELYYQYQQRLQHGYFSVFLLLQILLTVGHIAVVIAADGLENTLPDVISYCVLTLLCCPLVLVVFKEKLVDKYPFVPFVSSCLVIVFLVVADLAVGIYHAGDEYLLLVLRPAYSTHALLACYMFLPLLHNFQPIILGATVTLCHLVTLGLIVYKDVPDVLQRVISDAIYLVCVNGLGLYFRLLNEVSIRRTFLDRRACIESKYKVDYEKQQEEHLLLSILPRHIVEDVKEDIRRIIQHVNDPLKKKPFSDMYVKEHSNVSILFADVVNYSQLTVSLPVNKLVETLNELFGRFDDASETRNVLRIKFLGDCYNCVSGIPDSNPSHASSCVKLGLDMISIIRKVREDRKLNDRLNMRIGVHSGKVFSGLLGVCKWQYDVWSHDVIIANHMEQAGLPGQVHVTKKTLEFLGSEYRFRSGNGARRSSFLKKNNIETFFIVSKDGAVDGHTVRGGDGMALNNEEITPYNRRTSNGIPRRITSSGKPQNLRNGVDISIGGASRRRMVFMDDNLQSYQQTLRMADEQMKDAISNMQVGVYDRWRFREKFINPLCLTFEDLRWELPFIKQPDPLFKFYVGCALAIVLGMMAIQGISMPSDHWMPWAGFGVAICLLLSLLPLTWSHYIWNKWQDPHQELEVINDPRNRIVMFLYKSSLKVVWSSPTRIFLYLVMCSTLTGCAMLELLECDIDVEQGKKNLNKTMTTLSLAMEEQVLMSQCLPPWQVTETCSLVIIMSFLFLRIHFQLKLLVGCLIVGFFSWAVWFLNPELFSQGETWNPGMHPMVAHVLSIVFLTVTLHLLDRQTEYMNRLDYKWKRQLAVEQEEGTTTHMVNKMLLENILPVHVAKLYLNTNRSYGELYHEEYNTVAVMFATITGYALWDEDNPYGNNQRTSLIVLNHIICDFDKLLFDPSCLRVEKIKMAGWTYMAACGLDPGRRDSNLSLSRQTYSEHVLVVLARFATKMMRVLVRHTVGQDFTLRVGISHGKVTAGVVGSRKPLYDIWGDAVNMASRMDSTGESGRIQVPAETARVLREEGVSCTRRGITFVKGKGDLMTYFVDTDEELRLVSDNHPNTGGQLKTQSQSDPEEFITRL